MRGHPPQIEAALFQPSIQRGKVGEVRHALQHLMAGISNVLLDLPLLPSGRRIAEVELIDIVVRHGEEAHVDLPLLAAADAIHRRPHVVVNPTTRHAAKDAERVPVGIEQHLMGLQRIGTQQKGPAVRQLDMGHLQLRALAAQNRKVFAPVKLEGFARIKMQRHKGPAPRRLLFTLPIGPPPSCKRGHPSIGAGKAKSHEIGVQLLHCAPLFARLSSFGLQPTRQLLGKGIKLARPFRRREFCLDGVRRKMLGHCIPRHACQPRDLADRQLLPLMHPMDDIQKSHVDHSVAPAAFCFGGRFTWLSSQ